MPEANGEETHTGNNQPDVRDLPGCHSTLPDRRVSASRPTIVPQKTATSDPRFTGKSAPRTATMSALPAVKAVGVPSTWGARSEMNISGIAESSIATGRNTQKRAYGCRTTGRLATCRLYYLLASTPIPVCGCPETSWKRSLRASSRDSNFSTRSRRSSPIRSI